MPHPIIFSSFSLLLAALALPLVFSPFTFSCMLLQDSESLSSASTTVFSVAFLDWKDMLHLSFESMTWILKQCCKVILFGM